MEVLTRKHYADKVDSWIGKGNIIVLVGPRRVGKSYPQGLYPETFTGRGYKCNTCWRN